MGDMLLRLVVERTGAQLLPQTRQELLGLAQAQRGLNQEARAGVLLYDATGRALGAAGGGMQQATRGLGATTAAVTGLAGATRQFGTQTVTASRNTTLLRSGLTGLALQATGTTGPVGRLATGLLMFGGGSALVLGVAAGAAVIAGAIRLIGAEARETEGRITRFRDRARELAEQRDPTLAPSRERQATQAAQDAALARIRELNQRLGRQAAERVALSAPFGGTPTLTQEQARQAIIREGGARELQRAIAEFTGAGSAVEQLGRMLSDLANRGVPTLIESFELLSREVRAVDLGIRPEVRGLGTEAADRMAQDFARIADLRDGRLRPDVGLRPVDPQRVLQGAPRILPTAPMRDITQWGLTEADIAKMTAQTQQAGSAFKELTADLRTATKATPILASAIIGAVSGAIAAVVSGGGAGGALAAIGGIVSVLPGGQIPGAIIAGAGTIAMAADRGSDRPRVLVDAYGSQAISQMREIREGPDVVAVTIVAPGPGQVLDAIAYDLRRRERIDRQERLPSAVRSLR